MLERARVILAKLPYAYPPCGGCAEVGETEQFERESRALDQTNARTLAGELRASKIEALEEVARAGCLYCGGRWRHFRDTPVTGTMGWGAQWVHLLTLRADDGVTCDRPEVWDAISKLKEGAPMDGGTDGEPV
jgi:hypothetical protein